MFEQQPHINFTRCSLNKQKLLFFINEEHQSYSSFASCHNLPSIQQNKVSIKEPSLLTSITIQLSIVVGTPLSDQKLLPALTMKIWILLALGCFVASIYCKSHVLYFCVLKCFVCHRNTQNFYEIFCFFSSTFFVGHII